MKMMTTDTRGDWKSIKLTFSGKLVRASKYEEEISDGHLGINEKELNSMNKHIPGMICDSYSSKVEHYIVVLRIS